MADVDTSKWDGPAAMSKAAKSDDPAAAFAAICAGRRDGDKSLEKTWALPHHKEPGMGCNADGVRNAKSRLPQTQGLVNKAEAEAHLEKHMKQIDAMESMMSAATPEEIRDARRTAYQERGQFPAGVARLAAFPMSSLRAHLTNRDGRSVYEVDGYATVYERAYEMYDMFGSYKETMDRNALTASLNANPDVAFLVNHRGVTMARTANGTLELRNDSQGLHVLAWLNAERQDVRDIASAIIDGLVDEMSFAFMLEEGEWDEEMLNFRILQADINRGDVSAVNYGANPYTSISARQSELLRDLRKAPKSIQRAALSVLQPIVKQMDKASVIVDSDTKVTKLADEMRSADKSDVDPSQKTSAILSQLVESDARAFKPRQRS